jgi:hypothetical protein
MKHPTMSAFLILMIFAFACSQSDAPPPASVLPPGKFAAAYVGLVKLGVQTPPGPIDSSRQKLAADSVLLKLGTTAELFRTSLAWYNQDPLRWGAVMDSASKFVDEEQKRFR